MAIYIKPAPVLEGKSAKTFIEKASNAEKREKVDFSREMKSAKNILEKSKKSLL